VPDPARWLDRDALAAHISVRVDELPRLSRSGKLPAPSLHLGPRSPRWWSADVDAAFRPGVGSGSPDLVIEDAIAQIGKGRPRRSQEARGR
jgi:hypothetical protein